MGIQALTRRRASNILPRSTVRSRTRGNFFIGCKLTGWASLSISAEQACRTLPLITIVQEPQTSSRQAASQAGGVVLFPSAVTGLRWICISTEMTLALGRRSTWNSSHREACPGPSLRSILTMTLSGMASLIVVPGLGAENGVPQAAQLLVLDSRPLGSPGSHRVPQPFIVALFPRRHELGIVLGIRRLRLGQRKLRLVVAPPALVAQTGGLEDQVGDLQHVPELVHVRRALIDRAAGVEHVAALPALLERPDFLERLVELRIVLHHRGALDHQIAHLLPDDVRVLGPAHAVDGRESLVPLLLARLQQRAGDVTLALHLIPGLAGHRGARDHPGVDAGEERVGSQPVRPVVRVVALAGRIEAGDVGGLLAGAAG